MAAAMNPDIVTYLYLELEDLAKLFTLFEFAWGARLLQLLRVTTIRKWLSPSERNIQKEISRNGNNLQTCVH